MGLRLENISKIYETEFGTVKVLEDINLNIDDRQFVCILGQSGCGKTTLINVIAGFENKSLGKIFLNGEEVNTIGTDRIMMFQEAALFPWLNVIENVEFGMKMCGIEKNERKEKALKYLNMVNLDRFANSYIHQLSGGMRQRVALARALTMDSKVLLMDEPFSALDTYTKDKLRTELLKIWKNSGKTILFVTHDVEEAILLADIIIVMSANPGTIKRKISITEQRDRRRGNKYLIDLAEKIKKEFGESFEDDEDRKYQKEEAI